MKLPPYKNTSLVNIKGERWKEVPGLEGYCMISSFGRVKRLEYEVISKTGKCFVKPEKIVLLRAAFVYNNFVNEKVYSLGAKFIINGTRYYIKITRLVYYCFVSPFDMSDSSIKIICKEGNGLHIVPDNLQKANRSEISKRMYKRNRLESRFNKLTAEQRKRNLAIAVKKMNKQVSQYTIAGKKIKTYPSAAAAERATGVFASSVCQTANGRLITAGGFLWRWGRVNVADAESLRAMRRQERRNKNGQKVTQYDFNGNRVACYPSLQDAEAATGADRSAIDRVIKGKNHSAKGFFWQKGYGKPYLNLKNYKWGADARIAAMVKKVKQYTLDGRYVQTFGSTKEAADAMNMAYPSSMLRCCAGKQKTCAGYKWQYA
jgi:hypothetical protein